MFTGESIGAERKNFQSDRGSLTVKVGELIGQYIELYFACLLILFCLLIFHSLDE